MDDVQGLAKEVLTLLLLTGQDWDANTVDLMIEVFTKPFEPVVLTHTFKRGVGQIPITKQASWPSSDSQRKRLEEYLFKMNELVGELDEPNKRFYRKTTGALNDIIDRLGSIQKSQDDLALANSYH